MNTLVLAGRVVLSLACVLGLIWYAQRRLGGPTGRRRPAGPELAVVGRQSLGRHSSVAVLAAGDRRLLLGVTEQGITLLAELDPAVPAATEVLAAMPAEVPIEVQTRTQDHADVPLGTALPSDATGQRLSGLAGGELAGAAATAAAASAAPLSAAARLLARLPVQREEIDLSLLAATGSEATARGASSVTSALAQDDALRGGALDGSILAPSTWRRAARAVQHPRAARR